MSLSNTNRASWYFRVEHGAFVQGLGFRFCIAFCSEQKYTIPRGSIYPNYGIRPKKPSLFWFWRPNSIMVVYVGPSGIVANKWLGFWIPGLRRLHAVGWVVLKIRVPLGSSCRVLYYFGDPKGDPTVENYPYVAGCTSNPEGNRL